MALTSSQIIARSQSEVSEKLNQLLVFVPNGSTNYDVEVTPFGSNLFLITVSWNQTAIPKRLTLNPNDAGVPGGLSLRSTMAIHLAMKQTNKPVLGLSASVTVTQEGPDHFISGYTSSVGLKPSMAFNWSGD